MAGIHPAPRPDRNSRLGLLVLTLVGTMMFLWVVANLAVAAFGP